LKSLSKQAMEHEDGEGNTPLNLAVKYKRTEITNILLDWHANSKGQKNL
jgi:hypothetical protein